MTKPYKVLSKEIVDTERGMVNDKFSRFIGTADSLFSLFVRSYGHRETDPVDHEYIIVDKNPLHIEMFKSLLTWDGNIEIIKYYNGEHPYFPSFEQVLHDAKSRLGLHSALFPRNSTLGKITRHSFFNFTKAWNGFKNSKFTFVEIDIIKENERFLTLLDNLPTLNKKTSQFVLLDVAEEGEEYSDSINNILHNLWLKNIKQYASVVKIAGHEEDFAGKLYTKLNPKFCILPWMHIQYKPSGQSKLCCRYDTVKEADEFNTAPKSNLSSLAKERFDLVIQKTNIEDSFYSNYWNTARDLTIANKDISGCHKCYKEENVVGGEVATSMRLGSSILYNGGYLHKKPAFEKPVIEFLEVGFGNYCNLACLSCNSTLSTTWHDDEQQLNSKVSENLQRVVFPKLDNLKFVPSDETLETLKIIKFTGGEPMINPEFTKFIDIICQRGHPENISLEIYTNCSYIPSPKLLANLTQFKNIQLNLSIDAYGNVNDYIRYGSVWTDIKKQNVSDSIDFWLGVGKNHANVSIIMSTTLSILNILEIPKLMTWWMDKFKDSGNEIVVYRTLLLATEYDGFFKLQPAHDPNYININSLPKEYYTEVLEWINEYRDGFVDRYPELGGIPECIGASLLKMEHLIRKATGNVKQATELLEYLSAMDNIRNNSCEENIPKLISKVKEYLQAQGKQI